MLSIISLVAVLYGIWIVMDAIAEVLSDKTLNFSDVASGKTPRRSF